MVRENYQAFELNNILSCRSNVPSILLIRIPLILVILSVLTYFELVSQVKTVLENAVYAHDLLSCKQAGFPAKFFLAIY